MKEFLENTRIYVYDYNKISYVIIIMSWNINQLKWIETIIVDEK